jgi:hypothetical protein
MDGETPAQGGNVIDTMSRDTQRGVEEIRRKQWFERGTTLGAGGWPAVAEFARNWKRYVLIGATQDDAFEFTAANDEVAVAACQEKFISLEGCDLSERIVKHRQVPLD